jgi:putative phosphoesterase
MGRAEDAGTLTAVVIGLISDTHGLVRPEVHTALAGVELILHAGDVGDSEILDELAIIAPVKAVRGNTDSHDLGLPDSLELTLEGVRIHVSHGHEVGRMSPENLAAAYAVDLVVYGHTHRQRIDRVGETLVVNPGAAGARRFDLEPSVAIATIVDGKANVTLIPLAG